MKYLKISSKGEIDIRLIPLMGASTKTNDPSKIGTFGTGLKYAISYFLRNGIDFKFYSGEDEVIFTVEENEIANNSFSEIYCNGKSMNITTHYGHQWKAWEAIREIWCNALDEGQTERKLVDSRGKLIGNAGLTTFYIQCTKDIKEVVDKWEDHFYSGTPLYEDENVAIYPNNGGNLSLYKNTVLIEASEAYKSLFIYDLKKTELNELRQYRGSKSYDIGKALISSNKAVISILLEAIKEKKELFEVKLDWDYVPYDKKHVKQLFSGFLYMHPESDVEMLGKSIKVNATLFKILEQSGLPCEKVKKVYGGYYGGSGLGYSDLKQATYKKIAFPELEERINTILAKYNVSMPYIIGQPIKSDFEMAMDHSQVVFSSSLENLSNDDLEATIIIGILHKRKGNMYKSLKRLIKALYKRPFFRKMFFGKDNEVEDKFEPTDYEELFLD